MLVYEFMANGTLRESLSGTSTSVKIGVFISRNVP